MARAKKNGADAAPATTAQMLGSLLKSARDIMRKDKGLNGDLDRLPLLTWIMFLKFLDDLEQQREDEAKLAGKKFKPAIEKPYRWRDWAADSQGVTGDELLSFINADETVRPDGTKGAGLFAYLRSLSSSNGDNRRDVIATVFKGVDNRMKSGYLLRDIINKVGAIHFTSSDELHTLGALYESMLREMRDAAGDSGEFYTPRAVVRFMVEVTDPRLGETVLDPASGTGGFLVEAYNYLEKQVKTVADRKRLQSETISGCEPKSLPYLLCQMNLLLHGLDAPQIDPGNALRFKLSEIGEKERVDVILTNPPFGGEEEKGIQGNFPEDRQTSETALLFLQLIMRKLKRQPTSAKRPARAAVVVPDGTLFGEAVCSRIKQELLDNFNLHTIVRLPPGVFSPYTPIPTNILFFDRSGPTIKTWFYEQQLPPDRRSYSKTMPMLYDELEACRAWFKKPVPQPNAWLVDAKTFKENGYNLDLRSPSVTSSSSLLSPAQIVGTVASDINTAGGIVGTIGKSIAQHVFSSRLTTALMADIAPLVRRPIDVDPNSSYREIGIRSFGKGIFHKVPVTGLELGSKRVFSIEPGDLIFSNVFAWEGAVAVATDAERGMIGSHRFMTCRVNRDLAIPQYLALWFASAKGRRQLLAVSPGGAGRNRTLGVEKLPKIELSLPSIADQELIVRVYEESERAKRHQLDASRRLDDLVGSLLVTVA